MKRSISLPAELSVRYRRFPPLMTHILLAFLFIFLPGGTSANRAPQFVLNQGQSEIVLRLKEGKETPIGTLIHKLKGFDYDKDPLTFGVRGQLANDLLRVENLGTDEANIYLKKELDREMEDSYTLILTLTDGHLGGGSFVTQSLLILVEDVNDNAPICRTENSTVKVEENSDVPLILATIECHDPDEGPYGQVLYRLETDPGDEDLFTIQQTKDGKGILKLIHPLDYDRKFLYQLKVIASDRANTGQVNTATNPILVEVVDREDRPPEWLQVPSVTRIPEDVPKGSYVLQVRAIDGDRGVKNKISYSLLNENDLFGIDADSGILFTKGTLDREDEGSGGSYILQLLATERPRSKGKGLSISTEVTILLLDVNDETPRFLSRSYVAEVVENQPVDVPVTFLGDSIPECYDHDLGLNGTFKLYTEGDGGIFEITPSQGINQVSFLVRVKNPARLDYERLKVINFTLVAEEVGEEKKHSKVGMTVFLRDANDNSPRFEKEVYRVSINENPLPGTTVFQVRAQDDDSGIMGTEGIRYTALTGSIADELVLNPITGLITVGSVGGKNSFDRELSSVYFLTVEARDSGGRGNRNTAQIQLHILDVNDEKPIFLMSSYEGRIFENDLSFISPVILEAKDADLPNTKNSEIQYSIVSGNHDEHFHINISTGSLGVRRTLDFESIPSSLDRLESNVKRLNLTVRANDLGSPPLFSLVPVTIWVLDKNDFNPTFKKSTYHKFIREDTPPGTEILSVEAGDGDGSAPLNRIFYRVEGGAGDKFHVDAETGLISLSPGVLLDYNIRSSYLLHIFAVDGGGLKSTLPAVVNISIVDVNNKSPQFVVNTSDGYYHAKIKENSPQGTFIAQIRASDPDQKPILKYSLDFNRSDGKSQDGRLVKGLQLNTLFNLDSSDGTLRVGEGVLDREIVESIRLVAEVEDKGSETGKQVAMTQILIQILDEQDNIPIFRRQLYSASLLENSKAGTVVLTVTADDADLNTHLRYGLLPQVQDSSRTEFPLKIDPESGVITVQIPGRIDRETRQWLNFSVLAEDTSRGSGGNGNSGKSIGRADVFVRILDQNDNSPVFNAEEISWEVPENVKIGTVIGGVVANDPDEGANGKVNYVLDRKSGLGKFAIDPETGNIRVVGALDREETPTFSLGIQAFDNWFGYPTPDSRSSFKNVLVTLFDVNDSPPVFEATEENFVVTEFHDGLIGTIVAKDGDASDSPNSWIQFKIKSGNELGLFRLEQGKNSAKLMASRSLKGFYGNYTLVIVAEDGGRPSNTATTECHIQVTDFNDNPPKFITLQNLTISLAENASIGTTVVQIRAIDSDTGMNGVVRYRFRKDLVSHSDSFNINSNTGVITLAKSLDRSKIKFYTLRIEAYDHGPISLSTDLDLRIKVEKMTEFSPQFPVSVLVVSFPENLEEGEEKLELPETLESEDDEDKNKKVCYFILPDENRSIETFYLEPHEHWISPKIILDREERSNYSMKIVATTRCDARRIGNVPEESVLRLVINVSDENDNSPKFEKRVFSGGISTTSSFGSSIVELLATDLDEPGLANSDLAYYISPPIQMSLTEGLAHLSGNQSQLFIIDGRSILLNFDPQPDMKGFFTMQVGVRDGPGRTDSAIVLIYLLREDQKVKVVVRRNPVEVRNHVDRFLRSLGNITGARVNSDMSSFKFHENSDGSVDRTKTDFFVHFVHPEKNVVLEVSEVLKLIDMKIEELDELFKEFNVIDTQGSSLAPRRGSRGLTGEGRSLFLVYASGTAAFLALLLLVVISLACAQRSKYQRRLKAATANAYGSSSMILPRNGNVPNTNVHSGEGSNPIWMQAYHNNWYKEELHSLSENSETRDSLEDNNGMMGSSPTSSHMRSFLGSGGGCGSSDESGDKSGGPPRRKSRHTTGGQYHNPQHQRSAYHRNILYNNGDTNSTCLILKKHLETTEL